MVGRITCLISCANVYRNVLSLRHIRPSGASFFIQWSCFVRRWSTRYTVQSGCLPCVWHSFSTPTSSMCVLHGGNPSRLVRPSRIRLPSRWSKIQRVRSYALQTRFILHRSPNHVQSEYLLPGDRQLRSALHQFASRRTPHDYADSWYHRLPACQFHTFWLTQYVISCCLCNDIVTIVTDFVVYHLLVQGPHKWNEHPT